SLKTSIKTITYLSDIGCLEIQGASLLTDSRSFLSYTRHEYFRRILCNLLGQWAQDGEIPDDEAMLSRMVQDICFNNAQRYFTIK
ncbi:glucuronate isomerase, partial [Salmonella enterica]|nr:glucuronate isomerase [Salmonella enterica]